MLSYKTDCPNFDKTLWLAITFILLKLQYFLILKYSITSLGRPNKNGDNSLKSPISPSPVFVPINGFKIPNDELRSDNQLSRSLSSGASPKVCNGIYLRFCTNPSPATIDNSIFRVWYCMPRYKCISPSTNDKVFEVFQIWVCFLIFFSLNVNQTRK